METESNNQINFLDLTLIKNNGKIEFKIYRKPTTTSALIPFNSSHPFKHKLSAFHSMIYRALNIPMSPENKQTELDIIRQLATENKFPLSLINKIIRKHERRIFNQHLLSENPKKENTYRKFNYYGAINQKISKTLYKHNISCAVSQKQTLLNCLKNGKDPTCHLDKNGVYLLKCDNCNASYIGETGRKLKTRIQEHIRDVKTSNFGKHLSYNKHSFNNWNNAKLLHSQHKGTKLSLLEAYEIEKHRKSADIHLLNDQLALNYQPILLI